MRKFFAAIILASTMLTLLAGCGKAPIEKAQARAVEIGKQYLNYEITGQEAREMLDSIKVPAVESGNGQLYLEVDISALSFLILKNDSTFEEIRDKIDSIESRDYTE